MSSSSVGTKLYRETTLAFLRRVTSYSVGSTWPGPTQYQQYRVIAVKLGPGGAYAVLELTDTRTDTVHRTAVVIGIRTRDDRVSYTIWSEGDGPNIAQMPDKLLCMLTRADDLPADAAEIARCKEWRARCEQHLLKKVVLQPGVVFTVKDGVRFSRDRIVTQFKVQDLKKRLFVADPGTPNEFLAKLRKRSFEALEYEVNT